MAVKASVLRLSIVGGSRRAYAVFDHTNKLVRRIKREEESEFYGVSRESDKIRYQGAV
jgi:hypothetical protein